MSVSAMIVYTDACIPVVTGSVVGTGIVRASFRSTDGAGTPLVLWLADVAMGCTVIDISVEDDGVMLGVPMLAGTPMCGNVNGWE